MRQVATRATNAEGEATQARTELKEANREIKRIREELEAINSKTKETPKEQTSKEATGKTDKKTKQLTAAHETAIKQLTATHDSAIKLCRNQRNSATKLAQRRENTISSLQAEIVRHKDEVAEANKKLQAMQTTTTRTHELVRIKEALAQAQEDTQKESERYHQLLVETDRLRQVDYEHRQEISRTDKYYQDKIRNESHRASEEISWHKQQTRIQQDRLQKELDDANCIGAKAARKAAKAMDLVCIDRDKHKNDLQEVQTSHHQDQVKLADLKQECQNLRQELNIMKLVGDMSKGGDLSQIVVPLVNAIGRGGRQETPITEFQTPINDTRRTLAFQTPPCRTSTPVAPQQLSPKHWDKSELNHRLQEFGCTNIIGTLEKSQLMDCLSIHLLNDEDIRALEASPTESATSATAKVQRQKLVLFKQRYLPDGCAGCKNSVVTN